MTIYWHFRHTCITLETFLVQLQNYVLRRTNEPVASSYWWFGEFVRARNAILLKNWEGTSWYRYWFWYWFWLLILILTFDININIGIDIDIDIGIYFDIDINFDIDIGIDIDNDIGIGEWAFTLC